MDPYLEHPVLWSGLHLRLVVTLANQLQPFFDPRYVASVEERVYQEGPHAGAVDILEIHERRIDILDLHHEQQVVTTIEVVTPLNKVKGPGRKSYLRKQRETLARDCHLVEIDLLRRGRHCLSIPRWRARDLAPYDYQVCVNRWPLRNRFEFYPRRLRERLPTIPVPLAEPDPDVPLDIQAALEQVYDDGSYMLRVRYDEPCEPPLAPADQEWAYQCWANYCQARPDLFPPGSGQAGGPEAGTP
jgi:hypothetical protein